MLKQLIFTLVALFFLFVPNAYAHINLDKSNPTDGETITEEIQTIELHYDGKVEDVRIFKVIASDGVEMAIDSITSNEQNVTGTFAAPLPNDSYTVNWEIIGQDGHPSTGSFAFTVNEHIVSGKGSAPDMNDKIESNVTEIVDTMKTETDSENNNSIWGVVIVLGVIIIIFAVLSVYTYKRSFVKKKNK